MTTLMNNNNSKLTKEVRKILADEYSKENLPENLYSYFEEKYLYYVEGEERYDAPIVSTALELSMQYIKNIAEQLALGHSFDWATLYACYYSDYDNVVERVYRDLKEQDENLALSEMQTHAKSFGKDKFFENFYIELATEYGKNDYELELLSSRYSSLIQQSIAEGKSLCYAQKYAELKALYESPWGGDDSLRLVAEIFDFADKNGIDTTNIRNNCESFADACEEAIVNDCFVSGIKKLRETYKEDWQQEMLTILYNRCMDEYRDYQSKAECRKPRKKNLIEDTLDMMFPDGIDDGFTGVITDD